MNTTRGKVLVLALLIAVVFVVWLCLPHRAAGVQVEAAVPATTPVPVAAAAPLTVPSAPATPTVPRMRADWKDPFAGGPVSGKGKGKVVPPRPAEVTMYAVPGVNVKRDRIIVDQFPHRDDKRVSESPARLTGFVCPRSGQVWAILEDTAGTAKAVRVGHEFAGCQVTAMSGDSVTLIDREGRTFRLRLEP